MPRGPPSTKEDGTGTVRLLRPRIACEAQRGLRLVGWGVGLFTRESSVSERSEVITHASHITKRGGAGLDVLYQGLSCKQGEHFGNLR